MQRLKLLGGALLSGVLIGALLWLLAPTPVADAQAGITNFDNVTVSQDIIVGDDGTFGGNLSVTGVLAASEFITDGGALALDDSLTVSDSLTVGGASTLTGNALLSGNLEVAGTSVLTGATQIRGATDMLGNVSDSGGAWTVSDNVVIDGAADAVQLTVQGHSTQTSNPNVFVVENSAGVDQFTVSNTGDATVTDDLIVTDDASANDLTVADFVNITAQTAITLENGSVLTPTGSIQPVQSAAAAGVSGADIVHVTDYLVLVNVGAQTITFTETTGLISAGNVALGAGDVSTLIWVDDGWYEQNRSNN